MHILLFRTYEVLAGYQLTNSASKINYMLGIATLDEN